MRAKTLPAGSVFFCSKLALGLRPLSAFDPLPRRAYITDLSVISVH